MAGDWIKMRGALIKAPKLIRMARELHATAGFREWLTPGGSGVSNGQIVSDEALRCVTFALLGCVWSYAREHGKWVDDDIVLPYIQLSDLDGIAGVDGFGEAMESVNWAHESDGHDGVILPNFKEFNAPMTPAEKQREYRKRKKHSNESVTESCNESSSNVTTREEKSRSKSSPSPARTREDDDLVPVDWQPDERCVTRLRMAGITKPPDPDQVQAFIAHWRGQQRHVGSPNQIVEWFVKWMVGEKQRSKTGGKNQPTRKLSAVERNEESIRRAAAAGHLRD